jgi:type II secretion system protein C
VKTTEQVLISCAAPPHKQDCSASNQILSAPYFINGEIQGYLVYPGEDRDVFNSTGLKSGDLITEVAGQPLTDAKVLAEFFDNLSSGQSIQVMVERRGEQEVIETHTD